VQSSALRPRGGCDDARLLNNQFLAVSILPRHEKENMSSNLIEGTGLVPATDPVTQFSDTTVRDLARVFKLLADETRLRILLYLARRKELHVRALCDILGQSQPAVSHHLALLRMAELIEPRREGKHNFYRLMPHRFQLLLDTLFAAVPKEQRSVRFQEYVLSYSPEA
jgi:ArsR family transcriptional regulator